jgi:signal transduction histidine kinase
VSEPRARGTGPAATTAPTDPTAITAKDRADYRRITLLTFGVICGIFAVGASVQAVFVLGILPHSMRADLPAIDTVNLLVRLLANGSAVAFGLLGIALLDPQERSLAGRIGTGFVIAVGTGLLRSTLQVGFQIYLPTDATELTAETITASVAAAISLGIAFAQTDARRRLRTEERAYAVQSLRASAALEALQSEELRVRREVADGLHGTVQQRFIILGARLNAVIEARPGDAAAAELRSIRDDLDSLREQDLRAMSQLLYPARLEHGAVAAIRSLFQRLPATIATRLVISDRVTGLEGEGHRVLTAERRLLLVRTVEEALSNALKHGRATEVRLELVHDSEPDAFVVTFDDNGDGLPVAGEVAFNGLARLADQLEPIGGSLALTSSPVGGARLRATMPLGHPAERASATPSGSARPRT